MVMEPTTGILACCTVEAHGWSTNERSLIAITPSDSKVWMLDTAVPGLPTSSLTINWTGCPSMPPDAFTVLAQALYTFDPLEMLVANAPEQVHSTPTLIGTPVAAAVLPALELPAELVAPVEPLAEVVPLCPLEEHAPNAATTASTTTSEDTRRTDNTGN
jgi:hypothetical protein